MDCMRDHFTQDATLNGRFRTISPLNSGSFGMVFKALDTKTGSPVAIKCLTKSHSDSGSPICPAAFAVDDRSEELAVHSRVGYHSNIVNLVTSFETKHHVYLVLEFCANGDLYEAIRADKGPLETEHVRDFMLQLVDAVGFMHKNGMYHRDIKPENIFLTSSGTMKLGDFGLATTESWSTEYGVGSDRYMAPEQFESPTGHGYSPAAADIWAIGICLLNVLFGRNPFATPTQADPLFADYLRDRQSLFDVFPNMSQDTFNVLMQCLSLDADKRSLAGLRDALRTVVSFTTDDESLDDFCNGNDAGIATQNRQPLRTPSITSPQLDQTSFPWAKALQSTPQKAPRQLSVIQDSEEMFPGASGSPYKAEPDLASLASALDSGIGMSYKSNNLSSAPISVPVSSSLPVKKTGAMASLYGKDNEIFSKSWTDLWEEDEEELNRSSFESADEGEADSSLKPIESTLTRCSTPAIDIKPSSRGSSTPRVGLSELSTANSRSNSPTSFRKRVSTQVRQMAASAPNKPEAPRRTGSAFQDKWAALGSLRRGSNFDPTATPRAVKTDKPALASFGTNKKMKSRGRSGSWRKESPSPKPFNNELWNLSKDWRSPQQPNYTTAPIMSTPSKSRPFASSISQQRHKSPWRGNNSSTDDIGDLEWVGGWQDFQL